MEYSEYHRTFPGKDSKLPGAQGFTWYESSLIVPIPSPPISLPSAALGALYIHTDMGAKELQERLFAWQLTTDKTWKNITESYRLDDGTVEHPSFPGRVLCRYMKTGDRPNYINRESFKARSK